MADDHDTAPEERAPSGLEGWGDDWVAPRSLRDSTLQAVRERGLVGGGMSRIPASWWAVSAAAAALMFVAGMGLGSRRSVAPVSEPPVAAAPAPGPRYALFLWEDARYLAPAAGEMPARVQEYSDWAGQLASAGRLVSGDELGMEGREMRLESGTVAAGAVMPDSRRGHLTGYFIVGAATLDEALEVARGCPHLKYGGSVEVRPIVRS